MERPAAVPARHGARGRALAPDRAGARGSPSVIDVASVDREGVLSTAVGSLAPQAERDVDVDRQAVSRHRCGLGHRR